MAPRELVDDQPAGVVTVPGVLPARISQTGDEEQGELPLDGALVAGGVRLRLGRSLGSALGGLALGWLLALDGLAFLALEHLFRRRGESASSLDLLVVGLGNPGREHERDRHNAGWMVVDELARRQGGSWRSKFSGMLSETRLGDLRLALLKPETYMNDSGRSVAAAMRYFKVPPESLLVVHDDVDLEPARLQARQGGGLAGHNGLRSLAQQLGSQDFLRLRIGVGRPGRGDPRSVSDWVLSGFEPEDDVEALVSRASDAVEAMALEGLEAAQARFN